MKHLTLTFVISVLIGAASLLAQSYDLPNNDADCPDNCRQVPWSAGSDQWNSGSLPVYTAVPCTTGLTEGDGTTNNATAIQNCLNALSNYQAAVLPAGIYYVNGTLTIPSNKALRGAKASTSPYLPTADATQTTLKLGASGALRIGTATTRGTERGIASGYTKGSQTLVMNAGHEFTAGTWISVFEDGDSAIPTTAKGWDGTCSWCGEDNGSNLIQQFTRVETVDGNTITLSRPMYYTYASGNNPGAKAITWSASYAGIEDLRLNGYADHAVFINIIGALFSWVKGVETYNAGSSSKGNHINISWSHGVEVRDSYLHYGRDSSSDRNYGIALFFWNSDHKIENNILRHHRHSWALEGGGAGCAFLYNYVDDNYSDDLTYLSAALFNHGAHPMFNLFEGNIISHGEADSFWGSSSHNVLFRNWLWGDETGTGVPQKPDWGFYPLFIWDNQNYYSAVGNIIGATGKWYNPNWSSYTLRNTNCSGSAIYLYGCNFQSSYVAKANTSSINHGNYDYKTAGVAYWEGGANHTLKNSMYYGEKPTFFGSCSWPVYGPEPTIGTLPAMDRYLDGGVCAAEEETEAPVGVSGRVGLSGGVLTW